MAIIRNERARDDRSQRSVGETGADVELEEEIDYTWHPNEDEFVSPLTASQWAELLGDESFAQSDAGRAVRCLRDYGEPATFQQLSIRYRGTMGRYRRWLSEAAQAAGERFGVSAPQQNQYGMDEWWPLLYQTRNAGKPGAGIFEMALRPEVEEAFQLIEEAERQAKRAENARQLQRIEQLERARQEERRRAAKPASASDQRVDAATATEALTGTSPTPAQQPSVAPNSTAPIPREEDASISEQSSRPTARPASRVDGVVSVPMNKLRPAEDITASTATVPALALSVDQEVAPDNLSQSLPATEAFLRLMEQPRSHAARFVAKSAKAQQEESDSTVTVDYATRYAERLRDAIVPMRATNPHITLAAIARELGDESVERLQSVVNGQQIPTFAYLDVLRARMFVSIERLEASDGIADELPIFVTMHEVLGTDGVGRALLEEVPQEIAYVVDDSDDRRTGAIVRLSDVRCALLTRGAVRGSARRGDNAQLEAFIRMVDELDSFARAHEVLRTSRQVSKADWDNLVAGRVWPGLFLH